jgi:hypothetical protein
MEEERRFSPIDLDFNSVDLFLGSMRNDALELLAGNDAVVMNVEFVGSVNIRPVNKTGGIISGNVFWGGWPARYSTAYPLKQTPQTVDR